MSIRFHRAVTSLFVFLFALLPVTSASATTSPTLVWNIETLASANDVGQYVSLAYSPTTNNPAVAYYDATNKTVDLMLESVPGWNPGNCGPGKLWLCDAWGLSGRDFGKFSSMAFRPDGTFGVLSQSSGTNYHTGWLLYGTQNIVGAISLDSDSSALIVHQSNSLAYDLDGRAWASYYKYSLVGSPTTGQLRVGHETTPNNGNCGASSEYWCDIVDTGTAVGSYTSLALTHANNSTLDVPMVAYRGASGELKLAGYGSQGGSNCSPANAKWWCLTVDASSTMSFLSLFEPRCSDCGEQVHIAYYDTVNHQIRYAVFVGAGGNCGVGAYAGLWNCYPIANISTPPNGQVGLSTTNENGTPVIAYMDASDPTHTVLKLARYVASGGNCGMGLGQGSWQCSVVDDGIRLGSAPHSVGAYISMAVNPVTNHAAIAYYDATAGDLLFADQRTRVFLPSMVRN